MDSKCRYKRKELKALVALQKDRIGDIESKLSRVPEYGERSESDMEDSTLHVSTQSSKHNMKACVLSFYGAALRINVKHGYTGLKEEEEEEEEEEYFCSSVRKSNST